MRTHQSGALRGDERHRELLQQFADHTYRHGWRRLCKWKAAEPCGGERRGERPVRTLGVDCGRKGGERLRHRRVRGAVKRGGELGGTGDVRKDL